MSEDSKPKPIPSQRMLDFFRVEMTACEQSREEPTLQTALDSLANISDRVLAEMLEVDYDNFDRKDFDHEFRNMGDGYGPSCPLKNFFEEYDGDEEDDLGWCQAAGCEAQATEVAAVSENGPHDDVRHYCESCYDVYMVGVQHGRHHEAARHGTVPGRDSSQDKPIPLSKEAT